MMHLLTPSLDKYETYPQDILEHATMGQTPTRYQ